MNAPGATAPLGSCQAKLLYAVEVLRSIPDPRDRIHVRANDERQATDIAERSGYRVYGAKLTPVTIIRHTARDRCADLLDQLLRTRMNQTNHKNLSAGAQPAQAEPPPVLVRDLAEIIGSDVPTVCVALISLGRSPRSTNMAVGGEEAVAVAKAIKAQAEPVALDNGLIPLLRDCAAMLTAKQRETDIPKSRRYVGHSRIYVEALVGRIDGALARMTAQPAQAEPMTHREAACAVAMSAALWRTEHGKDNAAEPLREALQLFNEQPAQAEPVADDWTPTPQNINALPAPVRSYIHGLETLCDPAGLVADNAIKSELLRAVSVNAQAEPVAPAIARHAERFMTWRDLVHTVGTATQPKPLPASDLLDDWAKAAGTRFVSRSDGMRTTETVSRDDLLQLINAARGAGHDAAR